MELTITTVTLLVAAIIIGLIFFVFLAVIVIAMFLSMLADAIFR